MVLSDVVKTPQHRKQKTTCRAYERENRGIEIVKTEHLTTPPVICHTPRSYLTSTSKGDFEYITVAALTDLAKSLDTLHSVCRCCNDPPDLVTQAAMTAD